MCQAILNSLVVRIKIRPWTALLDFPRERQKLTLVVSQKKALAQWNSPKVFSRFIKQKPIASKYAYKDTAKKPAIPKKDEKPIMGLVSEKNYVVANAVENILAGILP